MKYLKYLFIILVLLVVAFFGMGVITPSITYESEVSVNKPIEEAWAVMSDESRVSEWLKEVSKIEPVSGTPNTVGAVSNVYVADNGQEMMMEETITELMPNEKIAMTFTMDFMNMDYEMGLEEVDGATVIRTKSTTTGNGMVAKSMVSLMKGAMKEQEDKNLNNLKKVIEENTKDYFPEPVLDLPDTLENPEVNTSDS